MFAVLHVADFSLQAVLRLEAGAELGAVALCDETRSPPVVTACTAAAVAAGVACGQTVPQAMARCGELVLRTARPAAEAEARASLRAAALTVSPQIEDTAPGVVTIALSALPDERRGPALVAAVAQLRELGLNAGAGWAETPWLAGLVARTCPGEVRGLRAEEVRTFLHDLPLAVAEPTAELAAILAGWGVRTLGELTALPKAEVTRRLGPAGLALWERAAGEVWRPLRLFVPAQEFAAELTLEHEVETLEPLLFVLRRLLDRLALELRAAGFVAGAMTLALKLSDETVYERSFRLPEPTARDEILFRALHTHLETLQTAATIVGVILRCEPVRPLVRQSGMFESGLRDPHGFAETLARVAALVGAERVGTPVLADTHRPDTVNLETPPSVVPAAEDSPSVQPRRGLPLRRYRPPLAATVELSAEAAPTYVWAEGVRGDVNASTGPWRLSGGWWDRAQAWRREEWEVELAGGGVYRLAQTPEGWFVEGEYD